MNPSLRVVASSLPDPPYPADTKANGFKQFVDLDRLTASKTWTLADHECRPWLLMIWFLSWRNVPCGTWEPDDEYIAARIGCKPEWFNGHREQLLRGWVLHGDGLLYHAFIAEQVLEMLTGRKGNAERQERFRRANQKRHEAAEEKSNALLTGDSCVSNGEDRTGQDKKKERERTSNPRGTRLDLTDLPVEWRAWARSTCPDVNVDLAWAKFCDYWAGTPGAKGRKLDWLATWRNWVRREKPNGTTAPSTARSKRLGATDNG